MNLESEKKLSMEELKQRNLPQNPASPPEQPPMPVPVELHPTQEDWAELLTMLSALYRMTAAQYDLEERRISQSTLSPTREQIAALAQDVTAKRNLLEQAGKKKEQRFSLRLPKPHLPHLSPVLLLIPVIALVLWEAWSSWGTLWSAIRMLLP